VRPPTGGDAAQLTDNVFGAPRCQRAKTDTDERLSSGHIARSPAAVARQNQGRSTAAALTLPVIAAILQRRSILIGLTQPIPAQALDTGGAPLPRTSGWCSPRAGAQRRISP
jgi:hypothetical protein